MSNPSCSFKYLSSSNTLAGATCTRTLSRNSLVVNESGPNASLSLSTISVCIGTQLVLGRGRQPTVGRLSISSRPFVAHPVRAARETLLGEFLQDHTWRGLRESFA